MPDGVVTDEGGCSAEVGGVCENQDMTSPEELLEALDPEQRRVAMQVRGPIAVLAGAGTGKTRAITYRIAYGAAVGAFDPLNVLAVTFTAKAAGEMRSRLRELGVPNAQARTFHAAALKQLTFFWPQVIGGHAPQIIEHKASLVAAAASRLGIRPDTTTVRDIAGEIEWAKVSMISAASYESTARQEQRQAPAGLTRDKFARLLDAYEVAKNERGVMDFEDVLLTMSGILHEYEDVARKVRTQYRNFVVDEYQDVSLLQQHLLDLWLGGRHDVCVVGDVAQTIYSFAGATPAFLTNFERGHPGARVVQLVRDYRSTPQIVTVANKVLGPEETRMKGSVHLVSQRPMGRAVSFCTYADEDEEAQGVATHVKEMLAQGKPAHEIAVLYRTNAQSEAFEQAFSQAQIPFLVHGGQRFFERAEVKKTLVLLRRLSVMPAADESFMDQVQAAVSEAGWSPNPPEQAGAVRERWDNLNAIVELARQKEKLTLTGFVEELEDRAANQATPTVEGVTLSTLHAAKGLEWDVVYLVGCSEGLLPISLAKTPEAIAEEQRLLYVGVTRARDVLEVSWARLRRGGRGQGRKLSRFWSQLWPQAVSVAHGSVASRIHHRGPQHSYTQQNKDFEEVQPPEVVALFQRLRAWRSQVATASQKPAYTVFSDQTLRDVAIAQPRTLSQLRLIRGIGKTKVERFGPAVLAIIRGEDPVDKKEG